MTDHDTGMSDTKRALGEILYKGTAENSTGTIEQLLDRLLARLAEGSPEVIEAASWEVRAFACVHRPEKSSVEVYRRSSGEVVGVFRGPDGMAKAQRSCDKRNARAALAAGIRAITDGGK